MFDIEKLEKELYRPVRNISSSYSISNPKFYEEIEQCISSFIDRNPQLNDQERYVRTLAFCAAQNYLVGKVEEKFGEELLKLGFDGIMFAIQTYVKLKELEVREKEINKK